MPVLHKLPHRHEPRRRLPVVHERKPDLIVAIGDNVVEVFGPGELTAEERETRWQQVMNAAWGIVDELSERGEAV